MFPRMNITTPLPSFAYCAPQFGAGVGFGVINPIASHMAPPYVGSPASIPYPVFGQSPYAVQPMLPCPPVPISAGIGAWCPPLSANPYAFAQPTPIHPAMQPAFAGASPAVVSSPVACCIDPVTGAVVPQPYPVAQSLLPIRPLITPQADPVQMAALCGVMAPQVADPYSIMAQACLTPSLAVSPVQQALRPPVFLSPMGSPQLGVPWTVTAGIPC
jgi:hypothetical protein